MPSAKILEQKQAVVSELVEKIQNSVSGVLVDYKGITVEDDTKLRANLRKEGVEYCVIKNTLISKAYDQLGFSSTKDVLNGMTAIAISKNDAVAAAKILAAYAKDHQNFVLKAGYVDGKELDAAGVKALSEIPSKEVLLGKLLGSMQSSLYKFVYGLQALVDKKNEGAEAAPAAAEAAAE